MPRYYCDYCDTYLTHDSVRVLDVLLLLCVCCCSRDRSRPNVLVCMQQAGRKQHNRGWKHRENVKLYYEQFVAGQGGVMTRTSTSSLCLSLTLATVLRADAWLLSCSRYQLASGSEACRRQERCHLDPCPAACPAVCPAVCQVECLVGCLAACSHLVVRRLAA